MDVRKNRPLNKKFQLKTSIVLIMLNMTAFFILACIGAAAFHRPIETIGGNLDRLEESIIVQSNIISSIAEYSHAEKGGRLYLSASEMLEDNTRSMDNIKKSVIFLKNSLEMGRLLLISIIVLVFLHGAAVFFFMIKVTNRIYGPAAVIEGIVDDLINGIKPEVRDTRKRDELKALHHKISLLAEKSGRKKKISVNRI